MHVIHTLFTHNTQTKTTFKAAIKSAASVASLMEPALAADLITPLKFHFPESPRKQPTSCQIRILFLLLTWTTFWELSRSLARALEVSKQQSTNIRCVICKFGF